MSPVPLAQGRRDRRWLVGDGTRSASSTSSTRWPRTSRRTSSSYIAPRTTSYTTPATASIPAAPIGAVPFPVGNDSGARYHALSWTDQGRRQGRDHDPPGEHEVYGLRHAAVRLQASRVRLPGRRRHARSHAREHAEKREQAAAHGAVDPRLDQHLRRLVRLRPDRNVR